VAAAPAASSAELAELVLPWKSGSDIAPGLYILETLFVNVSTGSPLSQRCDS